MDYTGVQDLVLNQKQMAEFYQGELCPALLENQYLLVRDEESGNVVDYFKKKDGKLVKVQYPTITNRFELSKIRPRNPEQYCAMDLLRDKDSKVKVLRGVYGSGKDYLMFNEALHQLEGGRIKKIIFIRPHITVGGLPDIGYLPGSAEEKLGWTLGPLLDKVGGQEGLKFLMENEQLEMVPLTYIRGRSFENSIIYTTEGQNMTSEIAKLLLGRVGEGSELWINADTHQVDKRLYVEDNGVNRMVEKLTDNPLFGYIYLPKTERSDVARLADLLD